MTMFGRKKIPKTVLSPHLRSIWGFVPIRYLILARPGYVVFLDDALEVDWKSTEEHDTKHAATRDEFDEVLNRAASVESGDWDKEEDEEKTIKFKRQIGEAIARALEGNHAHAMRMLGSAEEYRQNTFTAARRREAIREQVKLRDTWRRCFRGWTFVHYLIGISAILLSSLVASKPTWLDGNTVSILAWLVAAFTGLLTFLTPDKKADKYIRAWSILSGEITRYNTNKAHTVDDVLEAYHQGENLIHEAALHGRRSVKRRLD
jgi:hypothetical protein